MSKEYLDRSEFPEWRLCNQLRWRLRRQLPSGKRSRKL